MTALSPFALPKVMYNSPQRLYRVSTTTVPGDRGESAG